MATPVKTTSTYRAYLLGTTFGCGDYSDNPMVIQESWLIDKLLGGKLDPEQNWGSMTIENAIPTFGMVYSDWVAGRIPAQTVSANFYWQKAYCNSIELSKTKEGKVAATFAFICRQKVQPSTMTSGSPVVYDTPVVEYVGGQRETEIFRQNGASSVAAPPAALDKSTSDIGGDATKNGGKNGVLTVVPQMKVRVRRQLDVNVNGGISTICNYFKDWIGTRNSATFLGMAANSVVMEGMNVVKLEGPYYEIVWDFLFDAYYEHQQVPELDRDNVPKMNATGTNYSDVRWIRVSRSTQNHNGIFFATTGYGTANTTIQGFAEKGYW